MNFLKKKARVLSLLVVVGNASQLLSKKDPLEPVRYDLFAGPIYSGSQKIALGNKLPSQRLVAGNPPATTEEVQALRDKCRCKQVSKNRKRVYGMFAPEGYDLYHPKSFKYSNLPPIEEKYREQLKLEKPRWWQFWKK